MLGIWRAASDGREIGDAMDNEAAKQKAWTRPELKRLGVIKDVAGPGPVGPQGAVGKS